MAYQYGVHGQQSTLVIVAEASQNHPIFNGILPGTTWGATDVYSIRLPMSYDIILLFFG